MHIFANWCSFHDLFSRSSNLCFVCCFFFFPFRCCGCSCMWMHCDYLTLWACFTSLPIELANVSWSNEKQFIGFSLPHSYITSSILAKHLTHTNTRSTASYIFMFLMNIIANSIDPLQRVNAHYIAQLAKIDGMFLFSCDRVDCFVFFKLLLLLFFFFYIFRCFNFSCVFFCCSLISGEAEKVKTLIRLRAELSPLFTGKRNASKYAWA